MNRILVATDRSKTADRAVRFAAALADRYGSELLILQVLLPQSEPATEAGGAEATRVGFASEELQKFAREVAGPRGTARVVIDTDPSRAILQTIDQADVDAVVVGNVGMAGRREFLLGNIPNRISHNARCTVIIVNTAALGDGKAPLPRWAEPEGTEPRVQVEAKEGLKELFSRSKDEGSMRTRARRFREALEELGPTFAKLGQILSTRPDLLPPAFVEELAALQDNVPPLTEAEVVAVMEEELGVPWEDVFESIDPTPMAAGTIAEVHRATLTGGERVVVKVQRPTAEEDILQDLALFRMFAEKTADRPAFKQLVDMGAIVEHLSESSRACRSGGPRRERHERRPPGSCSSRTTGRSSPTGSSTLTPIPGTCCGGRTRSTSSTSA